MRKRWFAIALFCSLLCSPVHAKTFVGVLWPMFGPIPAIGLVELVAELRLMPDVEVSTYLHQSWPQLVDDIERQPKGTRTVVIGYSLGANSSVFVANKAKYVDLIIALQPSMFSWNPNVIGRVGRMIEIYNPNPWMTFGGMGSKKLIGPNIEYIANNDSHPGAQFNSEFRNLAKTEIARLSANKELEVAQAEPPKAPGPARSAALPKLAAVRQQEPKHRLSDLMAFADRLSNSVNAGDLSAPRRRLTVADMRDYAERTYHVSRVAKQLEHTRVLPAGGQVIVADAAAGADLRRNVLTDSCDCASGQSDWVADGQALALQGSGRI